MRREVFAGGIDLVERRNFIQVGMVELIKHFLQFRFNIMEIHQHTEFIELRAGYFHFHFPVVAVQFLAFALVTAQVMRRADGLADF